ncbi:hypothetical protein BU17DRAFT_93953 [Hysterangium stoloniferum]|nr:hypothetical protein BU17DRAFT_93953 [Hysterangium stoloniferum]
MKFVLVVPAVFGLLAAAAAPPSPPPPSAASPTLYYFLMSPATLGSPKCCKNVGAAGSPHMKGLLKPLNIVLKDPTAIIGLECTTLILIGDEKGETAPNTSYAARTLSSTVL